MRGHIRRKVGEQLSLQIKRTTSPADFKQCALMMSKSEPWITLRRTFADSLKNLQDPLKEVYTAVENEKIIAFMILQMVGTFKGYVQSIYVEPGHRGFGIGTVMMRFAEERIFKETPNVFICVSSFNKKARKLYRKLRYRKVGELKDFVVNGHSEILLRKTLGPLSKFHKKPSEISRQGDEQSKSSSRREI